MKKIITLAGVSLLSVISLTGCIGNGDIVNKNTNGGVFTEFQYKHSDGRILDCVKYDRGLTCDWASAKKGSN